MSAKQSGAQEAMQKFGRFLSGMVMPNIGAFIGWAPHTHRICVKITYFAHNLDDKLGHSDLSL